MTVSERHEGDAARVHAAEFGSHFHRPPSQEERKSLSITKAGDSSLDHLPDNERLILEREMSLPSVKVSYSMLFRYATKVDMLILIIGLICAAASGTVQPLMMVCCILQSVCLLVI